MAEAPIDKTHLNEDGSLRRHYHYFTRGYLANEICRRSDPQGRTIGQILKDSFTDLGIDAYVGLQEGSEAWQRIRNLLIPSFKSVAGVLWDHRKDIPGIMTSMIWCYPELVLLPRHEAGTAQIQDYLGPIQGAFKPSICPVTVRDEDKPNKRVKMGPLTLDKFLNSTDYKRAEQPGANGLASGRGLAKLAAFLANKGAFRGQTLMTPATWEVMHDKQVTEPEEELGGFRTQFSQGGVNHFRAYYDDQPMERMFKEGREGYTGWMGFGGSVCQYHTGLKIGFGYAPLDFLYYDPTNNTGAALQGEVVKCVMQMKQHHQEMTKSSS